MLPPGNNGWKVGGRVAKKRPGVIVYFDTRSAMKRLNYEQMGRLYEAILDYGEFGKQPDFDNDPYLQLAWDFTYPRIDSDGEAYGKKIESNKYGVYCREAKKRGIEPIPYESWRELNPKAQKAIYDNLSNDIV